MGPRSDQSDKRVTERNAPGPKQSRGSWFMRYTARHVGPAARGLQPRGFLAWRLGIATPLPRASQPRHNGMALRRWGCTHPSPNTNTSER